nr:urate hydroxylase PuuD [Candidatus Eremiobacteraeota bacterium]
APATSKETENGVQGELWSVHGGGFYHNQKYLTGPKSQPLTQNLHWFKWEAYTTWLSGMAMLIIVYWVGAGTYLIDKSVLNLTPAAAIAISLASLVVGWFVYDGLCKVLERRPLLLGISIFAFLVLASWVLFHLFGARAAYIHVGAIIGTIMVANVAHVIIPGQKKMLAQIRAGLDPDPRPGQLAKIRSVHNTYLTLPVLFIMISGHYPMTYDSRYGWLVLAFIGIAGVLVRYFFILTHQKRLVPALPIAAVLILLGVAVAIAPHRASSSLPVSFETVRPIFAQRCAVCHAARPTQPGFAQAPAGVLLDTPNHIRVNAQRIEQQAVLTHAMPLGNVTGMSPQERAQVGAWIAGGEVK